MRSQGLPLSQPNRCLAGACFDRLSMSGFGVITMLEEALAAGQAALTLSSDAN